VRSAELVAVELTMSNGRGLVRAKGTVDVTL
jgi:hypothetical protein